MASVSSSIAFCLLLSLSTHAFSFHHLASPSTSSAGKHVVFGRVKWGHAVVDAVEKVGSRGGQTSSKAVITKSGMLGFNSD